MQLDFWEVDGVREQNGVLLLVAFLENQFDDLSVDLESSVKLLWVFIDVVFIGQHQGYGEVAAPGSKKLL